jgi:asparagine synthase (glutamine-hydrolysing)
MCGIAGILIKRPVPQVDTQTLERMIATIHHRGPDDCGVEWNSNVGLGFRRLSIIDLSQAGHQPMWDETHTLCIVFNGEIYNYLELRAELSAKGYCFRSKTDTEIILQAYKEWGRDCVRRFNGMWSFAIYDSRAGTLFCSRDRFGVKPFYYYADDQVFLFASEIKAILASGLVEPIENTRRTFELVALGYTDTTTETLFKGIRSLQPGHSLHVNRDGVLREVPYWAAPEDVYSDMTLAGASEQLRNLFLDSVRLRLRSDVPVAALLSGGQDSSAIVCCVDAARRQGLHGVEELKTERFLTFSSCYDDPRVDEREYINAVVEHCELDARYVFPGAPTLIAALRDLIWHNDEPLHNSNLFAHWMLMKSIAEHGIRVVLSGQGADELLAGYCRHLIGPQLLGLIGQGKLADFLDEVHLIRQHYGYSSAYALAQMGKSLIPGMMWPVIKATLLTKVHSLYSWPHIARHWGAYRPRYKGTPRIRTVLKNQFLQHSLPRILHNEDRTSMAFSIEERFPFLDYRLVEFCFRLPDEFKIHKGETKRVMRAAMWPLLPPKIRERMSKIGFATPTTEWTTQLLASPYVQELLACGRFPGIPAHKVESLRREKRIRDENVAWFVWRFVNYVVWRDVFSVRGDSALESAE